MRLLFRKERTGDLVSETLIAAIRHGFLVCVWHCHVDRDRSAMN